MRPWRNDNWKGVRRSDPILFCRFHPRLFSNDAPPPIANSTADLKSNPSLSMNGRAMSTNAIMVVQYIAMSTLVRLRGDGNGDGIVMRKAVHPLRSSR